MKMKTTWILWLCAAWFSIAFFSCKSEQKGDAAEAGKTLNYTCSMHPQVVSEKPGTCPICGMDLVLYDKSNTGDFLTLSHPQQVLANITVDTIQTGAFASYKLLNGRLVTDPAKTEVISSRIGGRVEKLYVKQSGTPVRKGEPLYQIYSEELNALQQEYLLAAAQAGQFPQNQTFQQLREGAEQKLLLYGLSRGQLADLKKGIAEPLLTVFAGFSGVVSEVLISQGQYVSEGGMVMSLEDYRSLWVEADVYPAESHLIKKGETVQVRVSGLDEAVDMKIDFIAPSLQPGSQLFTLRGTIANVKGGLRAGMAASVRLPVSEKSSGISLPVDAVIHEGRGSHIWVETGEGEFSPREVQTGEENFNRIEIKDGVQAGEVVVVSGAYALYSEFVLKKGKNPLTK